jgi:hypothetical protein
MGDCPAIFDQGIFDGFMIMVFGRHIFYVFPTAPFCLIPHTLSSKGVLENISTGREESLPPTAKMVVSFLYS